MTASDRIKGVWRDKVTGEEFEAGGAMVGHLYSQPDRFERIPRTERMYHVVVIVERTGHKERMTAFPVTHAEGCTILSKLTHYSWRREQLEEVL